MNAYEEKYKESLKSAVESQARRRKDVATALQNIDGKKSQLEALNETLLILREAKAVAGIAPIESAMVKINIEIVRLEEFVRQGQKWIESDNVVVETLKRACPHVEKVYDHTDYHKSEDFHRCTLCGSVF